MRGERFVVRNNERGPIKLPDHIGDRERFSRTGHAEQCLVTVPRFDRLEQLGDRLALVAPWLVIRFKLERHPSF